MDLIKSIPLPLLVIDLEATCWDGRVPAQDRTQELTDMEVIETGARFSAPTIQSLQVKALSPNR